MTEPRKFRRGRDAIRSASRVKVRVDPLRQWLADRERAALEEAADYFDCSVDTIRRCLNKGAETGLMSKHTSTDESHRIIWTTAVEPTTEPNRKPVAGDPDSQSPVSREEHDAFMAEIHESYKKSGWDHSDENLSREMSEYAK